MLVESTGSETGTGGWGRDGHWPAEVLGIGSGQVRAIGIDADTQLEISTDGDVIVISPVRPAKRTARLKRILDDLDREHAGAFRRLAE